MAMAVTFGILSALLVLTTLSGGPAANSFLPSSVNEAANPIPNSSMYNTQTTAAPSFGGAIGISSANGQDTLIGAINSEPNPYLVSMTFLLAISIGIALGISFMVSHRLNRHVN